MTTLPRDLTDAEAEKFKALQTFLQAKTRRNLERQRFLDAKHHMRSLGVDIPPGMEKFSSVLNWPKKAVTAFASRLRPVGYSTTEHQSEMSSLDDILARAGFESNEPQAIEAAGEYGCAFVFTTLGDISENEPPVIVSPRSALSATCEISRRTGRVASALEKVDRQTYNLYLPGEVLTINRGMGGSAPQVTKVWDHRHRTLSVQCAPYTLSPTLGRPFGRSRVTRPLMDLTWAGMRTLIRQEVSAQFYMAPRLLMLGAKPEDFMKDDPRTARQAMWSFITGEVWGIPDLEGDDINGDEIPERLRRVEFEKLPQLSMQPFSDQWRLIAGAVSGETSLPLPYLGVNHDANPSSEGAMKGHESDLVEQVRQQWPHLNRGRKTLALNVLSLAESHDFWAGSSDLIADLSGEWNDPETISITERSQMSALQVQAGNMQPGTRTTVRQFLRSQADIDAAVRENERAAGPGVVEQLLNSQPGEPAQEEVKLSDRANTFGTLIHSGATPESAAQVAAGEVSISDIKMRPGAVPVTIRDGLVDS